MAHTSNQDSTQATKTTIPSGFLDHLGKEQKQKWKIIYIEQFGRCIEATEDIKEGELLFTDRPLMTGPKQNCGYLCLGCYRQLDDQQFYQCSKCSLPLCSKACEKKGHHHLECKVFSKAKFKFTPSKEVENCLYQSILPLRCLMLKDWDKKKWQTFQTMESHDDLRRGSELWDIEQKNICNFLKEKAGITHGDAMLHSITGVLDINCHEVKSPIKGTELECNVRGVFPVCAMMSHDCYSNTHHTYTDDMMMLILAARDIKKGSQITGTYTHLLSGTTERRKHLKYGKFFDCVCNRCKDPTEMGTYFSALRCSKRGCRGNILNKDPIEVNNKADYACDACGLEVPVASVSRLTNMIYYELQEIGEGSPEALENLYAKYQNVLHPNHFHIVGIKHSLSQLYGRCPGFLIGDLSENQMKRKIDCCRHVLDIIDVLDPGVSRLRGLTKYELHAPILVLANREFQQVSLTRDEFLDRLNESLKLLNDTVSCLKFEPPSSNEGQVCKIAEKSAVELRQWIATVKQLPSQHFLAKSRRQESEDPVRRIHEDLSVENLVRKVKSYRADAK